MFSMCSKLTPRARIPDTRIPQLMQPWSSDDNGTLYGIELDLTGKTAIVLILVLGTCLNFAAE